MTELESTLTAALRKRDAEISVSSDAWEQHLDLVAREGGAAPGVIRRWRTPVLLAAAVACLAIVGTTVATVGATGSGTVDPVRATVSSPTVSSTTSGPHSTVSAPAATALGPQSSNSGATPTSPVSRPAGVTSTLGEPPTSVTPHSALSGQPATSGSVQPPQSGPASTPGWDSTAPARSDTTTAGFAAVTLSCGSRLPIVDKAAGGIAVHSGSTAVIDNSGNSEVSVLGVGTVQVDSTGRVSSGIVVDPTAAKVAPVSVAPGGTASVPSLFQPSGSCAGGGKDQTGGQGGSSTANTTQTVVLIGPDLDHAVAYLTTDTPGSTKSTDSGGGPTG